MTYSLNQNKLQELSLSEGTPVYVMDMDRARDNFNRMSSALPFCTVKYAAKSNSHPNVLTELSTVENLTVVCGSTFEAMDCFKNGFDASEIQVTAVAPKDESIEHCIMLADSSSDFTVTVNSLDTLHRLDNAGYTGSVVLRLTPNPNLQDDSKYADGSLAKFGMPPDELKIAVDLLQTHDDINLVGFHNHLGGSFSNDSLEMYINHVEDTIERAKSYLPLEEIDVLNFGGGFGIPYKPSDKELDLSQLSTLLRQTLPLKEDIEFVVEPGRYIIADAGVLLTRVNTIKETAYGRFVGVDAGMSEFSRTTMFDVYHHISHVGSVDREVVPQTVAGPTCSGADIFCSDREFPKAQKGDLLQIEDVGAYGIVMANQFHSYPRPELVIL